MSHLRCLRWMAALIVCSWAYRDNNAPRQCTARTDSIFSDALFLYHYRSDR